MDKQERHIIAVAFGDPLCPRTFSGYSRHLFRAVAERGSVVIPVSSKQWRWSDLLTGCADFGQLKQFRKPCISVPWLWRQKTIMRLSERVHYLINGLAENVPILQVGTHILPLPNSRRPIYCVTDMTVKQAFEAGHFGMRKLRDNELEVAIKLQKEMFDSYEKSFVLCRWTKESLVKDYNQSDDKVVVVGAGANMPALEPDANKYGSKEILFVGIDWLRKGGPLLLNAFKLVHDHIHDAKLHIVGCRPKIVQDGVYVHGMLSRKDPAQVGKLHSLYRRANCFSILPEFDPFPNVLLEAQITRTPVVSLKTGSRADAVQDGVTGLLVGSTNPGQVANAIVRILSDSHYARRMGSAGYDFVCRNYTWPIIADKILTHIENDGYLNHRS